MNIIGPLLTFTELTSRTVLVCNGGNVLKPNESLHRTVYKSIVHRVTGKSQGGRREGRGGRREAGGGWREEGGGRREA